MIQPCGDASVFPQGEVERVLSMVDAVLLVVDATEGPMSQTKVMGDKVVILINSQTLLFDR